MTGTADLSDAFKTGKPLSLHLAVRLLPRLRTQYGVWVTASPGLASHEVR